MNTPANKTLTAQEWKDVQWKLASYFGYVELRVDGIHCIFKVSHDDNLKAVILPYIEGVWSFKFSKDDCPERRLFYRKEVRCLYSRAKLERSCADLPKRDRARLMKKLLDTKFEHYTPIWNTPRSLIDHLKKTATTIELVGEKEAANG